ncbi:MAG: toxin-activating lysine-acyltransferase [Halopseudomonas aestusnigri]
MLQQMYQSCGKIMWLWSNSTLHKSWPVALQTRFVLPPVLQNQFTILERDGVPRAYCSWAWLNLETETKFILDPNSLEPEDWSCGDRLWFIDCICPFAASDTRALRLRMAEKFPREVARALRVKPKQKNARIATFSGKDINREESHRIRKRLYAELVESLADHPQRTKDFSIREF